MPDAVEELSPDAPVTITLPKRIMKRVLDAAREHAYKLTRRGDPIGIKALSEATQVIGDAVGAPPARRFRLPDRTYHAVIAGDEDEYVRWLARARPGADYRDDPTFIDSVDDATAHVYSDYTFTGTAYRREDFQELMAAVKLRIFRRDDSR